MDTLTELANHLGTDKGTTHQEAHNYTSVYEMYFDTLRDKPIKMLEIGIWDHRFPGASVKLWTSYFTDLDFIGFEIQPEAKQLEQPNVRIYTGDQYKIDDLNNCITQYGSDYDIIIDDGIHTFDAIKVSFEVLYPHLKNGGIYVIEDIHANDSRYIEGWLNQNNYEYKSYCYTTLWSPGDKLLMLEKTS